MLTPKKYALPLFLLLLGGLLLWWYNQANPHIDPLPGDAEYGYQLISKTADNYGPGGRINIRSNGMNCSNCHLEAGKNLHAIPLTRVYQQYPRFRERSGTTESLYKRISDCFERSLQSIAPDSSTIGYVNSHTKVRKDLMLWKTSFDSYEKKLSITIKNNGLTNHRDSLPLRISSQSDSLHLTHILTKPLLPDSLSTMIVPFTALSALLKRYHITDIYVNVLNVGDERLYNNSTSLALYPPHSSRPLHINEFLYDEIRL